MGEEVLTNYLAKERKMDGTQKIRDSIEYSTKIINEAKEKIDKLKEIQSKNISRISDMIFQIGKEVALKLLIKQKEDKLK